MRSRPCTVPGEAVPAPARSLGTLAVALPTAADDSSKVTADGQSKPAPLQRRARQRRHAAALPLLAVAAVAALWAALLMAPVLQAKLDAWQVRRSRQVQLSGLSAAAAAGSAVVESVKPAAAAEQLNNSSAGPAPMPATTTVAAEQLSESSAGATSAPTTVPTPAPTPVPTPAHEADRLVADMQAHVALHAPAGSFWPAGCRWRESTAAPPATGACDPAGVPQRGGMFGGIQAVWRCHAYEYQAGPQLGWREEQPAACRLQPTPLEDWAADRSRLQPGNSSVPWGSHVHMSSWALEDWKQRQQQQLQGPEQAGGSGALTSADVATDVKCEKHYCIFRNAWYSGGRFFVLSDPRLVEGGGLGVTLALP